jgi:hypothetical protein
MSRHEQHEFLEPVARAFGWRLHPGEDASCEQEEGNRSHQVWMRPCAYDRSQETPVGCYCCTDMGEAMTDYYQEMAGAYQLARGERHKEAEPDGGRQCAEVPSFLPPYRPH